jgi:hypothetical protein
MRSCIRGYSIVDQQLDWIQVGIDVHGWFMMHASVVSLLATKWYHMLYS